MKLKDIKGMSEYLKKVKGIIVSPNDTCAIRVYEDMDIIEIGSNQTYSFVNYRGFVLMIVHRINKNKSISGIHKIHLLGLEKHCMELIQNILSDEYVNLQLVINILNDFELSIYSDKSLLDKRINIPKKDE